MNKYEEKYSELMKMTKEELVEMYLSLTPYYLLKKGFDVKDDGTIPTAIYSPTSFSKGLEEISVRFKEIKDDDIE